jgi:hypothetical protein
MNTIGAKSIGNNLIRVIAAQQIIYDCLLRCTRNIFGGVGWPDIFYFNIFFTTCMNKKNCRKSKGYLNENFLSR